MYLLSLLCRLRYRKSLLPVSAALAIFFSGCGNNKVVECNKLINTINSGHTLVTNFQGKDAAAATKLANDIDKISNQMQNLDLKDGKLKNYQSQFSQIYQDLAKAFRNTAEALQKASAAGPTKSGVEQVQKAKEQVRNAGKIAEKSAQQADGLASEINGYCNGKKN